MNDYFSTIDWDLLFGSNSISLNWNIFKQKIFEGCQKFIPMSSVFHQKSTPPWWTKALYLKRSLYFTYWTTKSTSDYCNYASQQNLVKAKVRSAQMTYEEKLVKHFKTNPKAIYAYLRTKQKVKETISHLVKQDGSVIESNEDIATPLGQFFKTTFNEENLDHIPELPERTTSRPSNITITEQSVLSGLFHLNSNKTPSPI